MVGMPENPFPQDALDDERTRRDLVEKLTLALLRLTCWREGEGPSVRWEAPLGYSFRVLSSLEGQGYVDPASDDRSLSLTEKGYEAGGEIARSLSAGLQGGPIVETEGFKLGASQMDAHALSQFMVEMCGMGDDRARPTFDPTEGRRKKDGKAFRLRVALKLERPRTCWREIVVPATCSFLELHVAIQRVLGFFDYHMFDFVLTSRGTKLFVGQPGCENDEWAVPRDTAVVEAQSILLGDVFGRTRKAVYHYDYGDGWECDIRVMEVISDAFLESPELVSGEGDAPPEDVGGTCGFEEFLRTLADAGDPEYPSMVKWADSQEWAPFNLARKAREFDDMWEFDCEDWRRSLMQGA